MGRKTQDATDIEAPASTATVAPKLPIRIRIRENILTLVSLHWFFIWINKYLLIIWMEFMFLVYWLLAINVVYGGLIHYWSDYLLPLHDQDEKLGDKEFNRFVNTVGIFGLFFVFSLYLFILLSTGLKKKSDTRLYAWSLLNMLTLPFLTLVYFYVLNEEGFMNALNLSLMSIIMARFLVILLVVDIAQEIRTGNICRRMMVVQDQMKKGLDLEVDGQKVDVVDSNSGKKGTKDGHQHHHSTVESVKQVQGLTEQQAMKLGTKHNHAMVTVFNNMHI